MFWIEMLKGQNFNDRVQSIQVVDASRLKIGKNLIVNIFKMPNNDLMNVSYKSYKLKCKENCLKT